MLFTTVKDNFLSVLLCLRDNRKTRTVTKNLPLCPTKAGQIFKERWNLFTRRFQPQKWNLNHKNHALAPV